MEGAGIRGAALAGMLTLTPWAGRISAARWLENPFALKIRFASLFKSANNRKKSKAKLATDFYNFFFVLWAITAVFAAAPREGGGLSQTPKPGSGEGFCFPSSAAGKGGGGGLYPGQVVAVSPASAGIKEPVLTPLLIP